MLQYIKFNFNKIQKILKSLAGLVTWRKPRESILVIKNINQTYRKSGNAIKTKSTSKAPHCLLFQSTLSDTYLRFRIFSFLAPAPLTEIL